TWDGPDPTTFSESSTSLPRSDPETRRCHLARRASTDDRPRCGRRSAWSNLLSVTLCPSKAYFHQQRPVVHPTNCRIAQDFDSSHLPGWTKDVIDASIVDCRVACSASEVTKAAQDVAIRFAVVFYVVGIQICLVSRFEFKVEITRDENL